MKAAGTVLDNLTFRPLESMKGLAWGEKPVLKMNKIFGMKFKSKIKETQNESPADLKPPAL